MTLKLKKCLGEEIKLKNDYTTLTASAKINFEGKDYNLAGLGPFHSDANRSVRKKSYEARFEWFNENQDKLDDIYDKLVKLRHNIAITLGYDNFFIELDITEWEDLIMVLKFNISVNKL